MTFSGRCLRGRTSFGRRWPSVEDDLWWKTTCAESLHAAYSALRHFFSNTSCYTIFHVRQTNEWMSNVVSIQFCRRLTQIPHFWPEDLLLCSMEDKKLFLSSLLTCPQQPPLTSPTGSSSSCPPSYSSSLFFIRKWSSGRRSGTSRGCSRPWCQGWGMCMDLVLSLWRLLPSLLLVCCIILFLNKTLKIKYQNIKQLRSCLLQYYGSPLFSLSWSLWHLHAIEN